MLEKYKLLIDEDEALLLQGLVEKVMQYEAKDVNVDYLHRQDFFYLLISQTIILTYLLLEL